MSKFFMVNVKEFKKAILRLFGGQGVKISSTMVNIKEFKRAILRLLGDKMSKFLQPW